MKKEILSLILALSLLFVGCGEPPSPIALVECLCEAEPTLPVGMLYTYGPSDERGTPIKDAHLQALFGQGCLPPELDEAECGAFYLSPTHPFEICVFRAKSRDGAQKLAALCFSRRDLLIRFWRERGYDDYISNTCVAICGSWVMLAVTADAEETKRTFRSAV